VVRGRWSVVSGQKGKEQRTEDGKRDGWMNGGMDEKKGEGQVATNVANVHELKGER